MFGPDGWDVKETGGDRKSDLKVHQNSCGARESERSLR
jgi:hypothetical protein